MQVQSSGDVGQRRLCLSLWSHVLHNLNVVNDDPKLLSDIGDRRQQQQLDCNGMVQGQATE